MSNDYDGINRLQEILDRKIQSAEPTNIIRGQEESAKYLQNIMRGRSSPKHTGKMLASFAYEVDPLNVETLFGWGRFYGRLKESGHKAGGKARKKKSSVRRVKAQPHLKPTFEANRLQLTEIMIQSIERG